MVSNNLGKAVPREQEIMQKLDFSKIKNGDQVIYQKAPTYRLTHLLENGHAKRNGGRVSPKVHIAPVEEELVSNYISRVEKRLSQ